jgi:hypothetical protein
MAIDIPQPATLTSFDAERKWIEVEHRARRAAGHYHAGALCCCPAEWAPICVGASSVGDGFIEVHLLSFALSVPSLDIE